MATLFHSKIQKNSINPACQIMLYNDFQKWVANVFVIATPIAWYAMHKWLQNFAYKTELSWWIFALAGLLALGVALSTISVVEISNEKPCNNCELVLPMAGDAAKRSPVEANR